MRRDYNFKKLVREGYFNVLSLFWDLYLIFFRLVIELIYFEREEIIRRICLKMG